MPVKYDPAVVETIEKPVKELMLKASGKTAKIKLKDKEVTFAGKAFRRFLRRIGIDPKVYKSKPGDKEKQTMLMDAVTKSTKVMIFEINKDRFVVRCSTKRGQPKPQ